MRVVSITVVAVIDDEGQAKLYCNENAGNTLEAIGILQREITYLEQEWKAQERHEPASH
jgi:hypothetical protein